MTDLLARLGAVFYLLCKGVAILLGIGAIAALFLNTGDEKWLVVGFALFAAICSWGIGRAVFYILAGE